MVADTTTSAALDEHRRYAGPKASVIVLAFRCVELLADCLRSVTSQRASCSYEVIVVDNGATPEVRALLDDFATRARVVRSRANRGFAGGCNFGASAAQGEYLVFVNDDAVPAVDWLEQLVTFADERPRSGAVSGMVQFPDGTIQEAGGIIWREGVAAVFGRGKNPDACEVAHARQVDYASGCGFLVRRRAFEEVGGFDERYFPAYYEDADLCLTLRAHGWEVWYTPTARLVHVESASIGPDKPLIFRINETRFKDKWLERLRSHVAQSGDRERDFAAAANRARPSAGRVLVIDDRAPELGLGSGYDRMRRTVEALVRGDWTVLFHPTKVTGGADLGRLGIDVIDNLEDRLAAMDERVDAIVVSRPHNLDAALRARHQHPEAALVYDAEALFFRRFERAAALHGLLTSETEAALAQADAMRAIERSIGAQADAVVTISRDERDWFTAAGARCPVIAVPPLPERPHVTPEPFDLRRGALFVAGWLAGPKSPNADGLVWFARHVLPSIRAELPWASVSITGRNPPARVAALATPQLSFLGHVGDLAQAYGTARVALAPIRFGSGVKLKTIESLAHGVPIVATTIGAEGIPPRWRRCVDVADDPGEFARLVCELLTDGSAWERRRSRILSVLAEHRFELADIWASILHQAIAYHTRAAGRQKEHSDV
jgi:GT2 family glycosyltransferase/glycosyltransferase involved in cell wall biosynthesis